MNNSISTIIAIILIGLLLFLVPVMGMAGKVDTATKTNVEALTTEFTNEIMTTGKLTLNEYHRFLDKLQADGSDTYDVEMEFKILDDNPGKKSLQTTKDKIGENVYYSKYTTQIMSELNSSAHKSTLKPGDYVYVTVKNKTKTLAQHIRYLIYKVSGSNEYVIQASQSGLVNGKVNKR